MRHQICPTTVVDQDICLAMFWAVIWPEFSVIKESDLRQFTMTNMTFVRLYYDREWNDKSM